MAYIWHMTVHFSDKAKAEQFYETWNGAAFHVPSGKCITLFPEVEKARGGEWECQVYPRLNDGHFLNETGGPANLSEVRDIDHAAAVMYERLRSYSGYDFALCGVEVGGLRATAEIENDIRNGPLPLLGPLKPGPFQGLVISHALYEKAGEPSTMVGFGSFTGDWWWPWVTSEKS